MKNYILFSGPRTGSTYFAAAIARQLSCLEPNTFEGGEYFRWAEYLQISPPSTSGPGNLLRLEQNPNEIEHFENKKPRDVAPHIYMGAGGRIERELKEITWGDRGPINFRRAWEESQRRLTLLENSYFPWVVKVHPEAFLCMDMNRFNRLVSKDTTSAVILYRSQLWDWFLSWVALRKTGVFQQSQKGGDWEKPSYEPQDLTIDFLKQWYINARDLVNMLLSYRNSADHIVAYEDLLGDPRKDAGLVTGIDLFPDIPHQVKLWTTEEKEKMISNLDEIKSVFMSYCKIMGYPSGEMRL